MKIEHLHLLRSYEEEPVADRLRLYLQASLERSVTPVDDMDDLIEQLAEDFGYATPTKVRMWLSGKTRIPMRKLPQLAEYTGLPLSILIAFWLGQEADAEHAEAIYQAARPKVTDDEMKLILTMREMYIDPGEWEIINR